MSDGNTATQVSPIVQEEDMSKIRELFERAANAIVQASELAKAVTALRADVDSMKTEVEHLRSQNRWLDEQLTSVRQSRDDAQQKARDLQDVVNHVSDQRDSAQRDAAHWQNEANNKDASLASTRKDRDDAQLRVMDLEDQLTAANARLEQARKFMEQVQSVIAPEPPKEAPKPVEQPNPAPTEQPKPAEHWSDHPDYRF